MGGSGLVLAATLDSRAKGPSKQRAGVVLSEPLTREGLLSACNKRWLQAHELLALIENFERFGFSEGLSPPSDPVSGQLLFYDRRQVKNFKADGISWVVRKGSERVQETYQSLKINGVDKLLGMYSRSQTHPSFRRRIYRTADTTDPRATKVMIHYREYTEADEPKKNKLSKVRKTKTKQVGGGGQAARSKAAAAPLSYSHTEEVDFYMHCEEEGDNMWEGIDEDVRRELLNLVDNPTTYNDTADSPSFKASSSSSSSFSSSAFSSSSSSSSSALARHAAPVSSSGGGVSNRSSVAYPPRFHASPSGILDFSPIKDQTSGGAKVLLVLASPIPMQVLRMPLQVSFGTVGVLADVLSPTVLRCIAPPHPAGMVPLCVGTSRGQVLTGWSMDMMFEYAEAADSRWVRPLHGPGYFLPRSDMETRGDGQPQVEEKWAGRSPTSDKILGKRGSASPTRGPLTVPARPSGGTPEESLREHKIRLVEKVGTLQSALSDPAMPSAASNHGSDGRAAEDFKDWLEDRDLNSLDVGQLESILEQYQQSVIKEQVQQATQEPAEGCPDVNLLDSGGYCLLHYCTLYNMLNFIPALVARGANVNQPTGCGATALHIAAADRQIDAVQLLLQYGADVRLRDADGLTAYQLAMRIGDQGCTDMLRRCCLSAGLGGGSIDDEAASASALSSAAAAGGGQAMGIARRGEDDDASISPFLQETFSSLSLADKCALTLSLASIPEGGHPHSAGPDGADGERLGASARGPTPLGSPKVTPDAGGGLAWEAEGPAGLLEYKMKLAISPTDRESLDAAMSMMGPDELGRLGHEAKMIQNNFRSWLLRKNYINLREAARTLQQAWRERRSGGAARTKSEGGSPPPGLYGSSDALPPPRPRASPNADQAKLAAETLQAATRRMIARRSQSMAALVIQRRWLLRYRDSNLLSAISTGQRGQEAAEK